MRLIKHIPMFLIVALLAISCTLSRQVTFEVLWAPPVEVPPQIQRLTLVNNALLTPGDTSGNYYGFQGVLYFDSTRVDTMLTYTALDALATSLLGSQRFRLTPDPVVVPLKSPADRRKPLSFDMLTLIIPDSTDGVVVLESLDAYDQVDYSWGFDDQVYARLTLLASASWRLYDLKNRRVLDRWNSMDTLYYYGEGYTVNQALQPLPDRYTALQDIAAQSGFHYASQIAPQWQAVSRKCLSDGSAAMQQGLSEAMGNHWEKAAGIWRNMTNDAKPNRASMACYNLAVASEVLGQPDSARHWLNQSLKNKILPAAQLYSKQLTEREIEIEKLRRLFGQ